MAKSIKTCINELIAQGRPYCMQSITYSLSVNCMVANSNVDDKILDMPGDYVLYAWLNLNGNWRRFKRVNVYYDNERNTLYFDYSNVRYYLDEFVIAQ